MTDSLEERLMDWEERLDRLEAALAPGALNGHQVLFVPSPAGYALVELDTAALATGESIELAGATYVVMRVARSPLPGDARSCGYLLAI